MRFLFITSGGLSGGLRGPAHELAACFRRHGRDVELLHVAETDFLAQLQTLLSERRPDIVLSFGGFVDKLVIAGKDGQPENLWTQLRIPFFKIIGDIYAYMPQHHQVIGRYQVLCYECKDHAAARSELEPVALDRPPTPITSLPIMMRADPGAPPSRTVEERTLYFHKNGNSSAKLEALWDSFPMPLRTAAFEIARNLCADIDRAFVRRIIRMIDDYIAADADRQLLRPFRNFLIAQIDDYVRRWKGERIVAKLKDLPIVVNGKNWAYLAEQLGQSRIKFIDVADHTDTTSRIKRSLGTLNITPNCELTLQERSIRAISFGNGLLEYETSYAVEHGFPHRFRLDDDSLPELATRALYHADFQEEFYVFRSQFLIANPLATAIESLEEAALLLHSMNSRMPALQDYVWWPN